jgi:hypothetical protein
MYDADDDMEDGGRRRRKQERNNRYDCEGYEGGCSSWDYKKKEGYGGCGSSNMDKKEEGYGGYSSSSYNLPSAPAPASVDYFSEPKAETDSIVPLMFSNMVSNNDVTEPFLESDYIEMKDYLQNPDGIKVYDEKTGQVGLPVTDMTQISAGENNKYVYDRTIGTIGFTSTKIGARQRDGADKIRGDLPIVPNKTGWFQTSADPSSALLLGAMNVSNGIANVSQPTTIQVKVPSGSGGIGAAQAMGGVKGNYLTIDDLQRSSAPSGAMAMMQAPQQKRELTVSDIQNAAMNQRLMENETLGENTLYVR